MNLINVIYTINNFNSKISIFIIFLYLFICVIFKMNYTILINFFQKK